MIAKNSSLKHLLAVTLLGLMTSTAGCAIHSQAPTKEVAYDFSDADFYDKDYAPSPNYESRYEEYDIVLPTAEPDVVEVISVREPASE